MDYLKTRVIPRIRWYDRRSVVCKRIHVATSYFVAVAGIVLVALLNEPHVPRALLACIAGGIAVASSLDRIGRFGDRWHLYRNAYEALSSEAHLFLHEAGPYTDQGSAKRLLVERIEGILQAEGNRWGALTSETGRMEGEHLPLP